MFPVGVQEVAGGTSCAALRYIRGTFVQLLSQGVGVKV